MRSTRPGVAGLALLAALSLSACGNEQPPDDDPETSRVSEDAAEKSGTGETRTDLEPLTKRFSALGDPVAATWMSGTMGSSDVPGPSTYWIDAVVEVTPAQADELRRDYAPKSTDAAPDVIAGLRDSLPDEPLLTSAELNGAFTEGRFGATAYLAPASHCVVLVALGE